MASLYLAEQLETAEVGATIGLAADEAKHAVTVARTRVGERLAIGNGRGLIARGTVSSLDPFALTVDEVRVEAAPDPQLWLVQALAKGDRDELAVQAATELGADEIVPWQAARSVSRWDAAKAVKGRARWSAIVREAAKQAHRAWIPDVAPLETTTALTDRAAASLVVVLEPSAPRRLTEIALGPGRDVVLVVGPEGGIAPEELVALEQGGAVLARLGETVLRTSTAGPAALAVVSASLRRW